MIQILTNSFVELIYTERYTDEQLKKYLELILSGNVDLDQINEFKAEYISNNKAIKKGGR